MTTTRATRRMGRPTQLSFGVLLCVGLVVAWSPTVMAAAPSAAAGGFSAAVEEPTPEACLALSGNSSLSASPGEPVQIVAATVVRAAGTTPEFCRVTGQIGGRIKFDARVPLESWEGRYVQVGGGGFCGTIPTATGGGDSYLGRGAAVASDDTGHVGALLDAEWGYNNDQAQIDWGYLAEHLTAVTAKLIIEQLYGRGPDRSYFIGCSTGGRQALMEAQRYPDDFDGIVAGAPANRQNYLAVLSQGFRERANHTPERTLILRQTDVAIVEDAVLAQCDEQDGVADGIVNDPRTCAFDIDSIACPSTEGEACLTAAQIDVLRKWYDDPRDSQGRSLYPGGMPVGAESGWAVNAIAADGPGFSAGGQFGDQVLRFLGFPTDPLPTYSLYDFNFDTDPPALAEMAKVYNADNPDMSAFRDIGGKLILWHGLADPLITPMADIDYYEDSLRVMGGLGAVQAWYRMFLLPGVGHCSGGPGPGSVDWYDAIVKWVEIGTPPSQVVASSSALTRPVFPYPLVAKFAGRGDPNDAASFTSVSGPRGRALAVRGLPTQTTVGTPPAARPPQTDPSPADPTLRARPLAATGDGTDRQVTAVLLLILAVVLGVDWRRRRTCP